MSNNRQGGYQPPTTTGEIHRQSLPTTAGNSPQIQSPITPTITNNNTINTTVEPNSTPESRLAAAIGRAIFNIPPTSFQDAMAAAVTTTTTTTPPLIRTTSNSSVNQVVPTTTNATPPKIPTNSPIRRTFSDTITMNYKQQPKKTITKKPIRRSLSDTPDYQKHKKTKTPPPKNSSPLTSTPESSNKKSSPFSEKLRDFVLEINKKYLEIASQEETVEDENSNPSQPKEEEKHDECVAVERVNNGDIKFDLSCSCGKQFEMLIKPNGYCFYRLT